MSEQLYVNWITRISKKNFQPQKGLSFGSINSMPSFIASHWEWVRSWCCSKCPCWTNNFSRRRCPWIDKDRRFNNNFKLSMQACLIWAIKEVGNPLLLKEILTTAPYRCDKSFVILTLAKILYLIEGENRVRRRFRGIFPFHN